MPHSLYKTAKMTQKQLQSQRRKSNLAGNLVNLIAMMHAQLEVPSEGVPHVLLLAVLYPQ